MINLTDERVMTLADAAKWKHWPSRRGGKKPHVSTIYRWMTAGLGGVKLEVIRVGGTLCTSEEACQRFCEQLTACDSGAPVQTTKAQQRRIANADAELAAAGI